MAVIERETRPLPEPERNGAVPPLENGDHLDQATFHARYEAMPESVHAELIGGIVFMASPVKAPHRRWNGLVMGWLLAYEEKTPGVQALDSGTVILSKNDEPEPDVSLHVLAEYGGRTKIENDYVVGGPEMAVEIASSSVAMDLHLKKVRYERASIDEYIVADLESRKVHWFVLEGGQYVALQAAEDGLFHSRRFPGLWLDPGALLGNDLPKLLEVVRAGCTSPEHAEFVARLEHTRAQREQP